MWTVRSTVEIFCARIPEWTTLYPKHDRRWPLAVQVWREPRRLERCTSPGIVRHEAIVVAWRRNGDGVNQFPVKSLVERCPRLRRGPAGVAGKAAAGRCWLAPARLRPWIGKAGSCGEREEDKTQSKVAGQERHFDAPRTAGSMFQLRPGVRVGQCRGDSRPL